MQFGQYYFNFFFSLKIRLKAVIFCFLPSELLPWKSTVQCEKDHSENLGYIRSNFLKSNLKKGRYKECHMCLLDKQNAICIRPFENF